MRSVLVALAAAASLASSAVASSSDSWQMVKRADGPTDVEILNFVRLESYPERVGCLADSLPFATGSHPRGSSHRSTSVVRRKGALS